ncbi:hypothetical protein BU16DRAFT_102132 [Lophium mytilinum]|uniref:Uncharacterized protein n=1 Tax=Lophium mytilinum TaxID=390894 RepID=A0A6A6QIK7_9PEZI|nr:hypothetical protein BU16DRAFT_102132 [Lophium mytilinum]
MSWKLADTIYVITGSQLAAGGVPIRLSAQFPSHFLQLYKAARPPNLFLSSSSLALARVDHVLCELSLWRDDLAPPASCRPVLIVQLRIAGPYLHVHCLPSMFYCSWLDCVPSKFCQLVHDPTASSWPAGCLASFIALPREPAHGWQSICPSGLAKIEFHRRTKDSELMCGVPPLSW